MAGAGHRSRQTSVPADVFGNPLDIDAPVNHPLFIRQEIDLNANGDPVEVRLIYRKSKSDGTEVGYRQPINPGSGLGVARTFVIGKWVAF